MKRNESPNPVASEFKDRLLIACENCDAMPAQRHKWVNYIQVQLELDYAISISRETMRKWFAGEARPRPDKMHALAIILGVDEGWLAVGSSSSLVEEPSTCLQLSNSGAANVVAGMLMLTGASCAFPAESDPENGNISLYVIIDRKHVKIHVAVGELDGDCVSFHLARFRDDIVTIGLVRQSDLRLWIFDLSSAARKMSANPDSPLHMSGVLAENTIKFDGQKLAALTSFKALGVAEQNLHLRIGLPEK